MRINNNFEGRLPLYKEGMIVFGALLILLGMLWLFSLCGSFDSLGAFFESFFNLYKTTDFLEGAIIIYCVTLVLVSFIIIRICLYIKRSIKFNKNLNLKYVDLLPDRVNFCFNRPQYNFVCGYDNIENLVMDLETKIVRTKNGSYIVLKQILLDFTVLNSKKLSIAYSEFNKLKKIYAIIDAGRLVKNFSYKFSGVGEIPDLKERIEDYQVYGYSSILTSNQEIIYKSISILTFVGALALGCQFFLEWKASVNSDADAIFTTSIMVVAIILGISFLLDIILIIDKYRDKKYRGF